MPYFKLASLIWTAHCYWRLCRVRKTGSNTLKIFVTFPLKYIKTLLTETLRFTKLNNYLLWRRPDLILLAFTSILNLLYAASIYKWFELFHFLVLRADYWFRSLKERSPHIMPCRHIVAVEVQMYSFLSIATPQPLYSREIPQEARLTLGLFWTGVVNFTFTGIRISKCPASIYQCSSTSYKGILRKPKVLQK